MALSLTSKIVVSVIADYLSTLDLSTVKDPLSKKATIELASGTGADQADRVFHDQRTLGAGANEDLDLAGGLTDAFGNSITFAKVKAIIVIASGANGDNIQVGGAASAQFVNWVGDASDKVNVRPGGMLCLATGDATAYAVTATSADLLRITNADGAAGATYDIIIIGTSA